MTAKSDSKPYGFIYCIENTVNGKKYIGQTNGTVAKRWKNHISDKTGCRLLKNALLKYGVEAFNISTVAEAGCKDSLNALEVQFIETHNTRNRDCGYNLNIGGKSGPQHPETIARRADALRGKSLSAEHRSKLSLAHMGHVRSEASKAKQSESATGAKRPIRSAEHLAKISASKTGKKISPQSEAHKAKIGAANRGKTHAPMSAEQKQKKSEAMLGKPKNWSAEGRERTLEASRAYWVRYRLEKAAQI